VANLRLRTSLAGQFIQLNSALELATGPLSKADRTSAVKACLAEAILNLAAEGETNPIKLSETALTRVRESCAGRDRAESIADTTDKSRICPVPARKYASA
jgi:hypothetical protein